MLLEEATERDELKRKENWRQHERGIALECEVIHEKRKLVYGRIVDKRGKVGDGMEGILEDEGVECG